MLSQISLKNFVIVEQLSLDLKNGMTALTGETGAGKSIIIDALDLVLGGRGSTGVVRHGCEKADITAIFQLTAIPEAMRWLQNHDLEQNEEVILRRVINKEGRSRHFINGQACPQSQVRELGSLLLNIHGQHEHQNLLRSDHQRFLLDRFAKHETLVTEVQALYQQWHEKTQQLALLNKAPSEQQAKTDLLQYQVKELQDLALLENEVSECETEHKQLSHGESLRDHAELAFNALDTDDKGVITLLSQAEQQIKNILELAPQLNSSLTMLQQASIQAQEAQSELRAYLDQLEIDPERLFTLEQRLNQIHNIARKHHVEPEALLATQEVLEQELEQLLHADEFKQQLAGEITALETRYNTAAKKLSESRRKASKNLSQQVTSRMQTLNMLGGEFSIQLQTQAQPTAFGAEKVEFHVAANPGQPAQPLHKVASGGEMSRISLALQMITAQKDDTPTLIFDEVDVGIGGGTAEVVGQLLRQLGEKAQVFCITHLPQVAALAHQHLQVEKHTQKKLTSTTIITLDKQPRIQEIARMLGGVKITEQTLKHATEMLAK